MVHRHHLHLGLAEGARRHGATIHVDSRIGRIDHEQSPVHVWTTRGQEFTFDLLIGSDGLKSIVRQTLFPDVKPRAPTNNAAYRALMPYSELHAKVPESKEFGNQIDVWLLERGYAIMYPISGGRDWNAVLSHYRPSPVTTADEEVDMAEMRSYYSGLDPRLCKIIDAIPDTKRWPLLMTGPLESWSSPQKNVVLMGDAAHSMTNHLAQGAATSMEDGAFLGRVLAEANRGVLTLPQALHVYERTRMPRAWIKQQASFIAGSIFMADEARAQARDASLPAQNPRTSAQIDLEGLQSTTGKVTGPDANAHHWNLWASPETLQSVFGYDAEGDADHAVLTYLTETTPWDKTTGVSAGLEKKWTAWFLPEKDVGRIAKSRGLDL